MQLEVDLTDTAREPPDRELRAFMRRLMSGVKARQQAADRALRDTMRRELNESRRRIRQSRKATRP